MSATSTRSIQEPKKHHYLPEFFTTAWCGPDGQLIRYVNRNGKIYTRPFTPGQIGYRRDLYRFQSASIENKTMIERHHFEQLDNAAAPVIEMLNHDNRPTLSEYDRIAIARFVLSLPARNPWGIARGQEISREVYGLALSDADDAKAVGLAPDQTIWQEIQKAEPNFVPDSTLIQMIEASTAPELVERLARMQWRVWDVVGSPFDLIFADRAFSANGNLLQNQPKNIVALPIGPKRFITGSPGPTRSLKPRDMATMMNREQATRAAEHIFARDRSHIPLAKKYLRKLGTWSWKDGK